MINDGAVDVGVVRSVIRAPKSSYRARVLVFTIICLYGTQRERFLNQLVNTKSVGSRHSDSGDNNSTFLTTSRRRESPDV